MRTYRDSRICTRVLMCVLTGLMLVSTGWAQTKKAGHKDCAICHAEEDKKAIKPKIDETCLKCHPGSKGRDHRVGIVSKIAPEGLPLGPDNKITCATCHDPHAKDTANRLLRMDFNSLCKACHKM